MPTNKQQAMGSGYQIVESEVMCVLTRFRLKSAWALPKFLYLFYKVRSAATTDNGLLKACMLIEDLRTLYSLSFWANERAILRFNTNCRNHISAANFSFQHLRIDTDGPHLWSAQFRLHALSPNNLRWDGMPINTDFKSRSLARTLHASRDVGRENTSCTGK